MARPRNKSIVQTPPRVKGFNPIGYYANESTPIKLNIEEFEVIRLLDYENMNQSEAAQIMSISRPSLTRIYERARKKIATMLTEGHQILIEGGSATYNEDWFECLNCDSHFTNYRDETIKKCPLCNNENILKIDSK